MKQSPMQGSFNAGELSPRVEGRVDVPKYAQGMKTCENVIPLIQGPGMRRGGFRRVGGVQQNAEQAWLVKFEFNVTQAYILEFGPSYIAFWANEGQVLSGGTGSPAYVIASPYQPSDLTDTKGNFNLRFTESADVIYIACATQPPQTLSRIADTNWVIAPFTTVGGPFVNLTGTVNTATVSASAPTGSVTLTASASIFTAADVGTLFYLGQSNFNVISVWEAGAVFNPNTFCTSNGKNYFTVAGGTTGGDAPDHTVGSAIDGAPGVTWIYNDPGFGNVLITGFTDSQHVTGTVVPVSTASSAANLPTLVVTSNPTTNWNKAAWSSTNGYPSQVSFFLGRLAWARGIEVWFSVSGDFANYGLLDLNGLVTDDMSIDIQLQAQEVNDVQWMTPLSTSVNAMICGCAGTEFSIAAATASSVFSPSNVLAAPISYLGSKNATPVLINHVLLFLQRAGKKLRDVSYDIFSQTYQSMDQTVLADHIMTPSTIIQMVYAQEPYSIIWGVRADGQLVGMTYSREEYADAPHGGWHRHVIGGGGKVESLSVIPAPDGSYDQLWAIINRTVNGVTQRSVEFMVPPHQEGDDPEDSFYVDGGVTFQNPINDFLTPGSNATQQGATNVPFSVLNFSFSPTDVGRYIHYRYSYQGLDISGNPMTMYATAKALITSWIDANHIEATITNAFPSAVALGQNQWRKTVTTISGLTWLANQTVSILGDGAPMPPQIVSAAGVLTLPTAASKVQIGYACPAKWQTMRFNTGSAIGTSQGKLSQINRAVVRLWETLGLQFGKSFQNMDTINFRSPSDNMDQPVPLFTGDIRLDVEGDWDTNPWLCFQQADPLPAMIVAIMPQQSTNDIA